MLLALSTSACASTRTTAPSTAEALSNGPKGHPSIGKKDGKLPPGHPPVPGMKPSPSLDEPGPLAEAWRRPFLLLDGRTGARLDTAALEDRLTAARVIYVGEKHDEPSHHQVQLEVLHRAKRKGSVAIGLEMVQRPFQAALDAFLATGDETALRTGVQWKDRWGFDFRLYRPIFFYAKNHGLRLVALNAKKELSRAVAKEGVQSLDPQARESLPKLDLTHTTHRARLRLIWAQHVAPHGGMAFEHFYAAQVVWDETMADSVARALEEREAPDRIVVLAGAGHVRYGEGIPQRAARRGATPSLTILPLELGEAANLVGSGVADILWVFDVDKGPLTKEALAGGRLNPRGVTD